MTASTVAEDQDKAAAHPRLDAPERAALRETVLAEIRKARPHPVAERTLLLILQGTLEPQAVAPGYRVLDRHGAPRLHEAEEGAAPRPFTLADLIAEQRAKNPGLFLAPEPEPAPEPEAKPATESALAAQAQEMRAATARFIGSQSVRARSLAEQSSVQGRALARSAAGAFATLRGRLRPDGETGGNVREGMAERLGSLRERVMAGDADGHRGRFWLGAAAVATGAMVLLAVIVGAPRAPETHQPPAARQAQTPPATTPSPTAPEPAAPTQTARAPSVPDNVTPPPEGDGRGDPEPDAPPPAANAITGTVQVIDTATLKVGGKLVHLFGVEWVRGGQADELARYIGGRTVSCQPAPGSENMNCLVDGRDLSEVVLYNGGGRASPEASPELVAAEDHARSERLGVWKR